MIALAVVVGELDGGVTEGQQGSQTPQDECGRNNPLVGVVIVGGGGVAVAMLVLMLVSALVLVLALESASVFRHVTDWRDQMLSDRKTT